MNTPDSLTLFERLSDPNLTEAERQRLEAVLAADETLAGRYAAFQLLREWPKLERFSESTDARLNALGTLQRARERAATDREVGRLFPAFAGAALAAAILVALLNVTQFQELANDSVEALFGLPATSVDNELLTQL